MLLDTYDVIRHSTLMLDPRSNEESPRFLLSVKDGTAATYRAKMAHRLIEAAQFITGNTYSRTIPNTLSADELASREIKRARSLQSLGYDISFAFSQPYPDAPHYFLCMGSFKENEWGAAGKDFFSRSFALTKSISETMERLLWSTDETYWKKELVAGHIGQLSGEYFDPASFSGFSNEQRSGMGAMMPIGSVYRWVRAHALDTHFPVWIPVQLVSNRAFQETRTSEPIIRQPNTNGVAAHRSYEHALYNGLLELIERDAFMITYFNQLPTHKMDLEHIEDARVKSIREAFAKFKLKIDVILLPTDAPTSVMCARVRDESGIGPALAVAAKAHHDPVEAIIGAISEAFGGWSNTRLQGLYKEQLSPQPWSMFQRAAWWAKPENADKLSWMFSGDIAPLPSVSEHQTSTSLAGALRKIGVRTAAVRLSSNALERVGVFVTQVVSPELQPINLDSHPYLGGARLSEVPKKLGFAAAVTPPAYPHPFL